MTQLKPIYLGNDQMWLDILFPLEQHNPDLLPDEHKQVE